MTGDYGMDFFDKEGKSISLREWVELFENTEYCRIRIDEVGPWTVSTVWLGLSHGHSYTGDPLIFETMLFMKGQPNECHRWTSLEAAQEGHQRTVEGLKEFVDEKKS